MTYFAAPEGLANKEQGWVLQKDNTGKVTAPKGFDKPQILGT